MNRLKTTMLLAVLTALLLWAGQAVGGASGLWFALVIAATMNAGAYWFGDRIVLRMYHALEVTPEAAELYGMVRELAMQAKLQSP
jgi:heat shock protein HtpX